MKRVTINLVYDPDGKLRQQAKEDSADIMMKQSFTPIKLMLGEEDAKMEEPKLVQGLPFENLRAAVEHSNIYDFRHNLFTEMK